MCCCSKMNGFKTMDNDRTNLNMDVQPLLVINIGETQRADRSLRKVGYLCERDALKQRRALRFNINRVQRLAACHKEPVTLHTAEADVRTNFWEVNLTNKCSVRGQRYVRHRSLHRPSLYLPKHCHRYHTGGRQQHRVPYHGRTCLLASRSPSMTSKTTMFFGGPGISDIEFFVIRRKTETVRFFEFLCHNGCLPCIRD